MILVDTSVWIDHLERSIPRLERLLVVGQVVTHAFVEGELACGSLRERAEFLRFLVRLPRSATVEHRAVRKLLERERLHGQGVGRIDLHLVASALANAHGVWTHDRSLERMARQLGVAA